MLPLVLDYITASILNISSSLIFSLLTIINQQPRHKSAIILSYKNCQTSQLCDLFYIVSCPVLCSSVHFRTFGKHLQLFITCIFHPVLYNNEKSFLHCHCFKPLINNWWCGSKWDDTILRDVWVSLTTLVSCLQHLASFVGGQTVTLHRPQGHDTSELCVTPVSDWWQCVPCPTSPGPVSQSWAAVRLSPFPSPVTLEPELTRTSEIDCSVSGSSGWASGTPGPSEVQCGHGACALATSCPLNNSRHCQHM